MPDNYYNNKNIMQNYLKFNTQKHSLSITFEDGMTLPDDIQDVMTIREGEGFYEVLQKQETGKNAPIFRFPINNTVIRYFH